MINAHKDLKIPPNVDGYVLVKCIDDSGDAPTCVKKGYFYYSKPHTLTSAYEIFDKNLRYLCSSYKRRYAPVHYNNISKKLKDFHES